MTYRMVVDTPHGNRAQFWFEARRDTAPGWWPEPFAAWWMRWRRISHRYKLAVRTPMKPMVVPIADETELYQVQAQLERAQG